jgi:hypothetical protein
MWTIVQIGTKIVAKEHNQALQAMAEPCPLLHDGHIVEKVAGTACTLLSFHNAFGHQREHIAVSLACPCMKYDDLPKRRTMYGNHGTHQRVLNLSNWLRPLEPAESDKQMWLPFCLHLLSLNYNLL